MTRDRLRRIYFGHPFRSDRRMAGQLLAQLKITQEASGTAREAPSVSLSGDTQRIKDRASSRGGLAEPPQVNRQAPRRRATEKKTAAISQMGGGMAEPAPAPAPVVSPSYAVPRKLIDLSKVPSDMESRAAGWGGR